MSSRAPEPRRHRLTVADYMRMGETGILAPDARVELIDGEIIDMAPRGSSHAGTVDYLLSVLATAARDRANVRVHNPVRLSRYSEPQPDLTLPEVWLVDLGGRRLVRYRSPEQGVYALVDEPDLNAALGVTALDAVAVALHRLFG